MDVVAALMESMGLQADRFRLVWCSSAEADRFAGAVREMTARVKDLGPSPFKTQAEPAAQEQEVAACR